MASANKPKQTVSGILIVLALLPQVAEADNRHQRPLATISIIIDDMGNALHDGRRAIALPGQITYSFLPHTPYSRELAQLARRNHKEIMLHVPMQSIDGEHPLGHGALTLDMNEQEFKRALQEDLDALPHIVGINNHMGSLLTQRSGQMNWVMQVLGQRRLLFVDSRTSPLSVAAQIAGEHNIPRLGRDIFLDNKPTLEAITDQFYTLVKTARTKGSAVAIGHPHPATIEALQYYLPVINALGVELVNVSAMAESRSTPVWQMSSSPSPKAAKN